MSPRGKVRMPRRVKITLRCPLGHSHASFVGVGGDEPGRIVVDVHGLLRDPPGILVAEAVVVVAVAQPIHVGRVLGVAPHVLQRAVAVAMGRVFGVAMELAAGEEIGLAAALHPEVPQPLDVLRLVGMDRLDGRSIRPRRRPVAGRPSARRRGGSSAYRSAFSGRRPGPTTLFAPRSRQSLL